MSDDKKEPRPTEAVQQAIDDFNAESGWRVGRKLGRALYLNGDCVGMVDTPAHAAIIVDALMAYGACPDNPRIDREKLDAEHLKGWRHGLRDAMSECEVMIDGHPKYADQVNYTRRRIHEIYTGDRVGQGDPEGAGARPETAVVEGDDWTSSAFTEITAAFRKRRDDAAEYGSLHWSPQSDAKTNTWGEALELVTAMLTGSTAKEGT